MIKEYKTKKGETRYLVSVYLGRDAFTGKEVRTTRRGLKSHKEAKIIESRLKLNYIDGTTTVKKRKFKEVHKQWLVHYKASVKPNTYEPQVGINNKHIIPVIGDYYIDKISIDKCQEMANEWYSTYTKASNLVSVVNRVFNFAIARGYCTDNPMEKIIRPKNTHKKPYNAPFYDKEQLSEFLKIAKEELDLRHYTAFRLLSYAGLRKAELTGLKWDDIDFSKNQLEVNRVLVKTKEGFVTQSPKTKSSNRIISFDDETNNILLRWRSEQKIDLLKMGININQSDQFIFTNDLNQHYDSRHWNDVLTKLIKKHDLPYITIHGFRHTHCSLLFEAGVTSKEVQDRLGHSSIATTMNIYSHVTKSKREEVAEKYAQYINT